MFGKIKGKLGDIFKKNEEIIEENPDEVVESDVIDKKNNDEEKSSENLKEENDEKIDSELEELTKELKSEEGEEKKGFFKKFFKKKDENLDDIQEVEDSLLEGVEDDEKEAILNKKKLPEDEVESHKKELDDKIDNETNLEKDSLSDVKNSHTNVEEVLSNKNKKSFEKNEVNAEDLDEGIKDKDSIEKSSVEDNQENIKEETKDLEEKSSGFMSKFVSKIKKKNISEEDFEKIWIELEIFLLEINVAYGIVEKIEHKLREILVGNSFDRFSMSEKIRKVMVDEVEKVLITREADFLSEINEYKKNGEMLKIMMLGVNGTGKTTSIAKLIYFLKKNNFKVAIAASDTFRAAAVEQLDEHCKKLDVKLIQHKGGSDPAAVAFDAVEHGKAKKLDIVLIDTAGRMPNNSNLMMELQKIKRVSNSQMAMFVGDSIAGNDLIEQINLFDKGVEINGVMLTKVDTDERPGSVVTTAYSIDKPIYFLGIGQNYEDLVVFRAREVAEKLFDLEEE